MLIEFRVQNHRSIREEQVFTMEATSVGDKDDVRPRKVGGYKQSLLPVAAIYGANASGKSNVLSALEFMHNAVLFSVAHWSYGVGVPCVPFAWGIASQEPSLFEVTFVQDSVRYNYGFVVDNQSVCEEWLYVWPQGRKQTWFERDGMSFKFGDHLSGENRMIAEVTRENALYLTTVLQFKHEQLRPVYDWFQSMSFVNPSKEVFGERPLAEWIVSQQKSSVQSNLFENNENSWTDRLEMLRNLLRAADVGIQDVKVQDEERLTQLGRVRVHPRIYMRHIHSSEEAWLPVTEESQGTIALLQMAPLLLQVLERGGVFVVDELEASLHPLLALELVRQFNDPKTNPKNAQLVFTTHNTNLLGNTVGDSPLRRDQIWLTEKDSDGATSLYPLTDYKPRKAENLERGYLQGRYGAIPFQDPFVTFGE